MSLESPLQSAIQRMGNNFLVATFVPSMAFIVISSIVFNSILNPPLKLLVPETPDLTQLIQSSIYLLLLTTILGFTLHSLSIYIYKAFEGYTFILGKDTFIRRSFLRRQKKRFQKNQSDSLWVEKQLAIINNKIDKVEGDEYSKWRWRRKRRYTHKRDELYNRQYDLAADRNENFPPELEFILPTRFGNILRSAEMYPGSRYGIDAVPLWGRLAHVIPDAGMAKIDDANNQCLFLLNAAVLSGVFSILCIMISLYQGATILIKIFEPGLLISHPTFATPQTIISYFLLSVLSVGIAWLFYSASLLNVSQYGSMIRASYDLYRFDLLKALHLSLPSTIREEKAIWRRLSYFMAGNEQWRRLGELDFRESTSLDPDAGFEYIHSDQEKKQLKSKKK